MFEAEDLGEGYDRGDGGVGGKADTNALLRRESEVPQANVLLLDRPDLSTLDVTNLPNTPLHKRPPATAPPPPADKANNKRMSNVKKLCMRLPRRIFFLLILVLVRTQQLMSILAEPSTGA